MRYLFGFVYVCALGLVLACGCSSDSDLPTRFGDCASPPCEVALDAFTMNPGRVHCESSKDTVELSCPATANQLLLAGTCGDYWAVRSVYYAFTGDFYQCIYDANQGELVGAKWSPDNHPTQFAGVQLPANCSLSNVCDTAASGNILESRRRFCDGVDDTPGFLSGWWSAHAT
jgi:hypothetical protein